MMSNSKQQFKGDFLSNDLSSDSLNSDFAPSNFARRNSAKLKAQVASSSLLDGVAVFPDGSVMWVPDVDATGNPTSYRTIPSYPNRLPCPSHPQNTNHQPSAAMALIKWVVKRHLPSLQRALR